MSTETGIGPSLRSLAGRFEVLSRDICEGRTISMTDVYPFRGVSEIGQVPSPAYQDALSAGAGQSLFQEVLAAFLTHRNWIVTCVPPGISLCYHPAASATTIQSQQPSTAVAAHWTLALFNRDGHRSGRLQVVGAGKDEAALWRACVVARLQSWHSFASDDGQRRRQAQSLWRAEEALLSKNPGPLRDYELAGSDHDEAGVWAASLFGAGWDLLSAICAVPRTSVAQGAWRLPDTAAHELRLRCAVTQDLVGLFFQTPRWDVGRLQVHAREWLLANPNTDCRYSIQNALHIIETAHPRWLEAITQNIATFLQDRDVVQGQCVARQVQSALRGTPDTPLPGEVVERASHLLVEEGQILWAMKLRRAVPIEAASDQRRNAGRIRRISAAALLAGATGLYLADWYWRRPHSSS